MKRTKKRKINLISKLNDSIITVGTVVLICLFLIGAFSLLQTFDLVDYTIKSNPKELFICSIGSMLILKSVQLFRRRITNNALKNKKNIEMVEMNAYSRGRKQGKIEGKQEKQEEISKKAKDYKKYNIPIERAL